MKSRHLRVVIPLAVLAFAGVGYVAHTGFGSLSAIGWGSVSLLCPVGALATMLASKTVIPRAVISIVIALVAIVVFGRAFCAWVCPAPLVSKLRTAFKKQDAPGLSKPTGIVAGADEGSEEEKADSEHGCGSESCAACSKCRPSDSRYFILGGTLLSAAVFGFPVFCLICPIGLSFALVFVLINLFGAGDVTWSVVAIPVVLVVEMVFFRKWCSHICPISALMSLVSKFNKTFRPKIDANRCIESRGGECGRCAQVCEVAIDPRHPERGADWSECIKCCACVDACPGKAITMPALPLRSKMEDNEGVLQGEREQ